MNIDVDIDLTMIRPDPVTGLSRSHCAVGRIRYPPPECGELPPPPEAWLIYLKNSLIGDSPTGQELLGRPPGFPARNHSEPVLR